MELTADLVRDYLPAFGYQPDDKDRIMIDHALERAINRAKAYTNRCTLPHGLKLEIINMAVGEFLFLKKSTGGLDDGSHGLKFKARITQFTEGDTNISATDKGKNDEANFDNLIDKLRHGDPYIIEHYRRLHW